MQGDCANQHRHCFQNRGVVPSWSGEHGCFASQFLSVEPIDEGAESFLREFKVVVHNSVLENVSEAENLIKLSRRIF